MTALILAAGYAVRLKELTQDNPKSLLEVGGKKIIDRILDKVEAIKGLGKIYIITNAKFFEKFSSWLNESRHKGRTALINDGSVSNETRLGAIRDVAIVLEEKSIYDDLIVVAGDNLFDFDLNDFLEFASQRRDGISVALHDIKDIKEATRFGVVEIDGERKVADFEEKPKTPKSTLISTGIYYFPKGKLSLVREYVRTSDSLDAPGYYVRWMSTHHKVYGFIFSEDWHDIGDPESYAKANKAYSEKES